MYNQNNNHRYSKANPGGFIAPNSINSAGGFINPNTTNPGGFRIPTQPIYFNNDKHRNSLNQYPPISTEDNRRDSISIKQPNDYIENSNSINNIVQSPINITPYPPYQVSNNNNNNSNNSNSNSYPLPTNLSTNNSDSYLNHLANNTSYPPTQKQAYDQITNPADLQRRFYGTCKACGIPNSDFAECSSCKNWILQMETMLKARKSLIDQQLCTKCQLPNHVHSEIAACAKCGFPKSRLEELNKIAVRKENENDDYNNNNSNNSNNKKIGLTCGNCNNPLVNYLKCPTFIEVAQRMRKERECLPYEDPNFAKLSKIIKVLFKVFFFYTDIILHEINLSFYYTYRFFSIILILRNKKIQIRNDLSAN
jgi:hypothetical protein